MSRPLIFLSCFVLVVFSSWPLHAESDDSRFLDGLRSRRLFRLSESYSEQQLAGGQLSDTARAETTIELIRSYAAHAVHSPPRQRTSLWKTAHDTAATFARDDAKNPRLILVRLQDALTLLAEGELSRQEAEVGAGSDDALKTARDSIRQATRALEQINDDLDREIPRRRNGVNKDELTSGELFILQNNVIVQLARAYRNQALSYPPNSPDRTAALTTALKLHGNLMDRLAEDDPLRWKVQIDRIVCSRHVGRLQQAAELITALQRTNPPPRTLLRSRAELVRLYLTAKQADKALQTLAAGRESAGRISPELDFAHLETYLALWRMAEAQKDEKASVDWQKKSAQVAKLLEEMHGPYWSRRANLLLTRTAISGGGTRELDILVRAADSQYLNGEFAKAVEAYESAANIARQANDAQQTFALSYKAALVLQQKLKLYDEAGQRLQKLALAMKQHPQAGRAHLLAVWNASQWVNQEPAAISWYDELLQEHLKIWSKGATAHQARIWLGRLRQHQQSWKKAIEAYAGIPPNSPHFTAAIQATAQCWLDWLGQLKAESKPFDQHAQAAAKYFEDVLLRNDNRLPETFQEVDRHAALTAARVHLQYTSTGHKKAAGLLQQALKASPDAPAKWRSQADSLLVVALAGQPDRLREAGEILDRLNNSKPEQLLTMLEGLSRVASTSQASVRGEIATMQLDTVALLANKRNQLDRTALFRIDRITAAALSHAGQIEKSKALYKRLIAAHPNHGPLQIDYARLLLTAKDRATLGQALSRWRLIASRSKPRSQSWYEAKYSVALSQYHLGEKEKAAQLIRYLQATVPALKTSKWNAKFEQLLRQCQS